MSFQSFIGICFGFLWLHVVVFFANFLGIMHPRGKRREERDNMFTQLNRRVKLPKNQLQQNGNNHEEKNGLTTALVKNGGSVEDSCHSLINRTLPRELILKIFSFLDLVALCRCASVCKYWNVLAHDGSIWQDVDLFEFQRDVQSPVIENIAKRCGLFLKRLNLRGCQHLGDEALGSFCFFCRNLEVLVLQECRRVTDETCRALGRHCARLRRLNMDSCANITDAGLQLLAEGCRHLADINMSWCDKLTVDGIKYLAQHCVHLRTFVAKGCSGLNDDAVRALADNCHQLKILNLSNCALVTDVGIQQIGKQCPELEYVSLSNCTRITDDALISLAHGCPQLQCVELAGCSLLTDSGFAALLRQCPELHCLDMEECLHITDTTLTGIAAHCHKMERLCLSHCELVSDEGIHSLARSPAAANGYLKVLELDNCPLVTDAALDALQECLSLQRIDLYDCQQVTRGGIRRLKASLRSANIHAYFAPITPPPNVAGPRQRICRCCSIL